MPKSNVVDMDTYLALRRSDFHSMRRISQRLTDHLEKLVKLTDICTQTEGKLHSKAGLQEFKKGKVYAMEAILAVLRAIEEEEKNLRRLIYKNE